MTKRDVYSISLKILGVFSIIYAIRQIPSIVIAMSITSPTSGQNLSSYWFLVSSIASIILALAVTYILLKWGDLIAKKLVKEDSDIAALSAMDLEEPVFKLSLRIIGVVCLIRGIPELFNYLIRLASLTGERRLLFPNFWGGVISAIVLLIIGIYLILGGKRLVRFVLRESAR